MIKLFLSLLLVVFTVAARADIVFIDMNNVDEEINAAREAAKKRGEKLIVIPTKRDRLRKDSKEKQPILEEQYAVGRQYNKLKCRQFETNDCKTLLRRYQDTAEKLSKFESYSVDELKEDLKSLPKNISTVMISGHDGEGSFKGEFGNIQNQDFLNAFKEFKGRNNIKSLYLLGCYSTTTNTMSKLWKQAFPSASLIAGYEGVGFLRDNPQGHAFIRKALAEESNLLAAKSINEAQTKFRDISPKQSKYSTAACLQKTDNPEDSVYLSATREAGKLNEVLNCQSGQRGQAINYLKCIHQDGKNCPLSEAPKLWGDRPECRFVFNGRQSRMNDELYLLSMLGDPQSQFNSKNILAYASPEFDMASRPNQEVTSFKDFKDRLLAIKKKYEASFDFDRIQKVPLDQLEAKANEKAYFDRVWLGVSNLDLAQIYKLSTAPSVSPGELRAQAFAQKIHSGETKIKISQRIQSLNSDAAKATGRNRDLLQLEIEALRKIQVQSGLP